MATSTKKQPLSIPAVKGVGLKVISEQFRDDMLRFNLRTPPDVVIGLTDLGGSLSYTAFRDQLGKDASIHDNPVSDPSNIMDVSQEFRQYLMKRNLQTPSDIELGVIDLSANMAETMRNLGGLGTDATVNWRSVVVDTGTVDNAAMVSREANLSRNRQRDLSDPSETKTEVNGEGYNYDSLLQTIGTQGIVNNFIVPNFQSISSPDNKTNKEAEALNLKQNRYIPDSYYPAEIRENILQEVYKKTTYVTDYTGSLKTFTQGDYQYKNFYNLSSQVTLDNIINSNATLIQSDTMMMNIAAYMLNYNLKARFEQNLYTETLGRINAVNQSYEGQFPASMDPLELIKIAKDPMNNLIEKNYAITVPRNFVSKTAQFLLGLEGVVSPFDLWESVDLGGKEVKPNCFSSNDGSDALTSLDPTFDSNSKRVLSDPTAKKQKINDDDLINKTGGGQRWALYENLVMNKYSPKFDKRAEMLNFHETPKGNYYLGSSTSSPIDLLQTDQGFNLINNNVLSDTFKRVDNYVYDDTNDDIVWTNEYDKTGELNQTYKSFDEKGNIIDLPTEMRLDDGRIPMQYSTDQYFRPCSMMDITQRLLWGGGVDSPISNIKTKFRDGQYVYSKGGAVAKVDVSKAADGRNIYNPLLTKDQKWENGFCRTWTKVKPFNKIAHLVRYGELIRRERNSVIDRNANYNIFPSKLNVGTLYDQQMLAKDGIKDRFADKNFDKSRARKFMFSIENLAWKDSEKFESLPTYQQGPSGGRIMWFPPYGLTFSEQSNANWTKHDFLGRPEAIYTYNNTERTGQLSWQVIVDHPSILNVLVQKELAGMTDIEVDAVLEAFFAGCLDYDIFELARIWGVFSNADIQFFKDVINGDYKYPVEVTVKNQKTVNSAIAAQQPEIASAPVSDKIKKDLSELKFLFPNNVPSDATQSYSKIKQIYENALNGGAPIGKYDYSSSVGKNAEKEYFFDETGTFFNWTTENEKIVKTLQYLGEYCKTAPTTEILKINLQAYASTVAPSAVYNTQLALRRAQSVALFVLETMNGGNLYYEMDIKSGAVGTAAKFEADIIRKSDKVICVQLINDGQSMVDSSNNGTDAAGISGGVSYTQLPMTGNGTANNPIGGQTNGQYVSSDIRGLDVDTMLSQAAGWKYDTPVNLYKGSSMKSFTATNKDQYASSDKDNTVFSVLSYPACYARRVVLRVETLKVDDQAPPAPPPPKPVKTPIEYTNDITTTRNNIVNKRDIATRILNKLIGENEYFQYLSDNSPVVFNSLKEKLKYFSPAFHSMTPEGLNARLTFMQQCMRPGETVKTNNPNNPSNTKNQNDIVNTAFGKPPICVLRIGDFYNTKIVIDQLSIDYAQGSSVTYDLNPEGIGVQPMIAKVSITFKYIGGSGLREPVAQLQNALSFNYYANADIYESMSFGQTDLDERYLENLEMAYGNEELDISQLNLDEYQGINYSPLTNFEYLGKIAKTYDPIDNLSTGFTTGHTIKNGLDIIYYLDMDYSELFKKMYTSYVDYNKNYLSTLGSAGLDTMYKDKPHQYDFLLYVYAGMVDLSTTKNSNFKSTKFTAADLSNKTDFIQLINEDFINNNYFSVGYDSYNKSKNFVTPTLHLYPQAADRIVDTNVFNLKPFAGCVLPKYMDANYINVNIDTFFARLNKQFSCEEWVMFRNKDVRNAFNSMHINAKLAFRNLVKSEALSYVNELKSQMNGSLSLNVALFTQAYANIIKSLPILNGIDGGTSTIGVKYLEAAPKLFSEGFDAANLTTFFGAYNDDALNKYPAPQAMDSGVSYSTEYFDLYKFNEQPTSTGWSTYNFTYLKSQLTQTGLTSNYPIYDFTSGIWDKPTTPQITSIFEKLNYEFAYFSDLTLSLLSCDTLSANNFHFEIAFDNFDFSSTPEYTSDAQRDIRTVYGLSSGSITYPVYKINWVNSAANSNDTLRQTAETMKSNSYQSLEEVLFWGLIKGRLMASDFPDKIATAVNKSVGGNVMTDANFSFVLAYTTAIQKFVDGQFQREFQMTFDKMIAELRALYTSTSDSHKSIREVISKGGDGTGVYTMRMFEVDFTKANTNGKNLLNTYYKFKENNIGVLQQAESYGIEQARLTEIDIQQQPSEWNEP